MLFPIENTIKVVSVETISIQLNLSHSKEFLKCLFWSRIVQATGWMAAAGWMAADNIIRTVATIRPTEQTTATTTTMTTTTWTRRCRFIVTKKFNSDVQSRSTRRTLSTLKRWRLTWIWHRFQSTLQGSAMFPLSLIPCMNVQVAMLQIFLECFFFGNKTNCFSFYFEKFKL